MSTPNARTKNQDTFVESRSRSRRYLLPILLIGFALLFLFLPTIVVRSPLKQIVLNYAAADIEGVVTVEKINASWLAPIELTNVKIQNRDNQEIVSVDSIQTSQTLLGFLTGKDYGILSIRRPTIDLVLRSDGSNLEDVLAKFIGTEPSDDPNSSLPKVEIKIAEGLVRVRSDSLPQTGIFDNLGANIRLMNEDAPLSGEMQLRGSVQGKQTGILKLDFEVDPGHNELITQNFAATIDTQQFPLAAIAPVLNRIIGPSNCSGMINSQLSVAFDTVEGSLDADVQSFSGKQIAVIAPEFIGQDQFAASFINATGEIHLNSKHTSAREFKIESEFAKLTANGEFDFEQLVQLGAGTELPASDFQLDGVIDLAQIAAMLPDTSRLRDGVTVKSGILQVTANTRNENNSPRMVVNLETANMNFTVDGQNISWNQPLRAVAVAAKQNSQLMLEDFRLQSDFFNASGFAGLDRGKLQINGDLNKVVNQLNQLIDSGGIQLSGLISGEMNWQVDSNLLAGATNSLPKDLPIRIKGKFAIEKPAVQYPGMKPWREAQLNLVFDSDAIAASTQGPISINASNFDLTIGNERLTGVLAKPIENLAASSKVQFKCNATGSIAKWIAQARNFSELPEFFMDGNLNSEFLATYSTQAIRLNQIQLEANEFNFDGFGLNVREPKISGRVNLRYQFDNSLLQISKSKLTSPTFAANTEQLDIGLASKILADGAVNFRANANRSSQWIGLSMPGDSVRWDGTATGTMTFDSKSNDLAGQLVGKIVDLVFFQPITSNANASTMQTVSSSTKYAEFWAEPDVRLKTDLTVADDFNSVQLSHVLLKSSLADARGEGTISELATNMRANLTGQWNIKWENINQTIREMAGDVIQFNGEGWQPFRVVGPLYDAAGNYSWIPNQLGGTASISWNQAAMFDVPLGASKIDIQLNQSLARLTSRNNSTMVDKVFQMQPLLDLRNDDLAIHMQNGKLLDQWQVTVEDSRTWLKYAAPLIADATAAQGVLSTDLEGAFVPLFDPMKSSARGEIQIHELNIGPGPLVQQLIPMIDQILAIVKPGSAVKQRETWMRLKPQNLPIVVDQGRVYHEGFEVSYKDIVIRTRGSVGFDQSLNMVADIPIVEDWVQGNQYLSRLVGKSISIPVEGTLSKPQIDRRSIAQLTQQLLRDSALGAVNEKVNGEVNKFQQKVGNQIQGELKEFQGKINDQFQDKVQDELRNGLNKLFGGDKEPTP